VADKKFAVVRELLYWSYANLAMAHSAVSKGQEKYAMVNYMVRARLFKGLVSGTMNVGTLFDDEKVKLLSGQMCSYCASTDKLALDHIFPQKHGGKDSGDNLIYACRTCNSSKGKKDLMEWLGSKGLFPPLMVLRRYLKLVITYCEINGLMDLPIEQVAAMELPFNLNHAPVKYPKPSILTLVAGSCT